jgi:predicted nucleic-acid-binding Zn-ribbon protein
MKSGQCPKCGSHEVFSNTNRKFPALNTMTIGSGNFGNRYAYLDTYVCVRCGYVENYVAKQADLNYIQEEWTSVREDNNQARDSSSEDSVSLGFASL